MLYFFITGNAFNYKDSRKEKEMTDFEKAFKMEWYRAQLSSLEKAINEITYAMASIKHAMDELNEEEQE